MKKRTSFTLLPCLIIACAASAAAQGGDSSSGTAKPKPYTIENHELKLTDPVVFADRSDKFCRKAIKPRRRQGLSEREKSITLLRIEDNRRGRARGRPQLTRRRALRWRGGSWSVVGLQTARSVGFGGTSRRRERQDGRHAQNLRSLSPTPRCSTGHWRSPTDGGGKAQRRMQSHENDPGPQQKPPALRGDDAMNYSIETERLGCAPSR